MHRLEASAEASRATVAAFFTDRSERKLDRGNSSRLNALDEHAHCFTPVFPMHGTIADGAAHGKDGRLLYYV